MSKSNVDTQVIDEVHGVESMTEKLQPLLTCGMVPLRNIVMGVIDNSVTKKRKKEAMIYRKQHIDKVFEISNRIMLMYLHEEEEKLHERDRDMLKMIGSNDLDWVPGFLALVHDVYKFTPSDQEHGALAAKFMIPLLEYYDIGKNPIVDLMEEAIKFHSSKQLSLPYNMFFNILCDADILSKYTMSNIFEKQIIRFNSSISIKDAAFETQKANATYTGKTPFFKVIREEFKEDLQAEIRKYSIRTGIESMVKGGEE